MRYRLKNKANISNKNKISDNNCCFSQDIKDINSIESNLDEIIFQKMDMILNQQKNMENRIKSPKFFTPKKANHYRHNKLIINKRITLGKFLIENNIKKEIIDKENRNKGINENKKKNEKENETVKREKEKKETLSFFKRKELERQKNLEKFQKELANKNFRITVDKADHIIVQKKLGKRYTLFKTILIYLESNNITLYELLTNNPFQSKPYEIRNSYDFLFAVKFKNYDYVREALNYSKKFLFSFDYYGQTAYHWAAKLNDIKMLKLLIDFGLYHNQKDFKGRTPLYLAAYYNQKEVCIFLLNNNGNIFLKDKKDLSPADVAGSHELKYYLFEYMTQPFSNPIYKARVKKFLKDREERIKKKREQEFFERKKNLEKERLQKLLKEEEEEKKEKEKENKEKDKLNIINKEDK